MLFSRDGAKKMGDVLYVVKGNVIFRVNFLFVISRDEFMQFLFAVCSPGRGKERIPVREAMARTRENIARSFILSRITPSDSVVTDDA